MIDTKVYRTALLMFAVALGAAAVACDPSSQASEAEANDQFVKVVNVEVAPIALTDFTAYIRLTGEVEALNDVIVSAEESGVIERLFVEKGALVRKGAAIAKIGGVIERLFVEKGALVRKGAAIAKIEDLVLSAQVQEARAAFDLASERYERQRRLWEDEQIGSEINYLEARYQAQLQEARLEFLEARLERTVIRAPISGVFDERYVDAGEMVAPGTRVARVVEVDRVKVTGGVPERFAAAVQPGDTAQISFEVLPEEVFLGQIGFVGSTVDERNRTFQIEIVIDNPGRLMKPQMVANVLVAQSRLQNVVVVPQSAVMRTEDGYEVYVVGEQDGAEVAVTRAVRLGPTYANQAVVEEGLAEGDRLIVRGQQLVEVGDHVQVVDSKR
jgi:RND family efflux transporter MFP subunit